MPHKGSGVKRPRKWKLADGFPVTGNDMKRNQGRSPYGATTAGIQIPEVRASVATEDELALATKDGILLMDRSSRIIRPAGTPVGARDVTAGPDPGDLFVLRDHQGINILQTSRSDRETSFLKLELNRACDADCHHRLRWRQRAVEQFQWLVSPCMIVTGNDRK